MSNYHCRLQIGKCEVCAEVQDLRLGTCFKCSSKVTGSFNAQLREHTLWETARPENVWSVPSEVLS